MPPYDPKANRPKLVPVDGDPAPVDALLGPAEAAAPVAPVAAAPQRAHLSVVAPDERAPRTVVESPVVEPAPRRPDPKVLVAVGAIAIAVVGMVVAARRRSH